MSPNIPSPNTRNSHPWLSYYKGTSDAELALSDLVAEGISEQDFTLVKLGETQSGDEIDALENVLEPFGNQRNTPQNQMEGSPDRESRIGGGIDTSTPDDDVSGIEEMDDSESAAEELLYPASGRSIGDEEKRDIETGANTGFFETTRREQGEGRKAEPLLTEFTLPNIGVVIGEGSFGERLTEAVFSSKNAEIEPLVRNMSSKLNGSDIRIGKTGGLLAIDAGITGPSEERIEEILRAHNAEFVIHL